MSCPVADEFSRSLSDKDLTPLWPPRGGGGSAPLPSLREGSASGGEDATANERHREKECHNKLENQKTYLSYIEGETFSSLARSNVGSCGRVMRS